MLLLLGLMVGMSTQVLHLENAGKNFFNFFFFLGVLLFFFPNTFCLRLLSADL